MSTNQTQAANPADLPPLPANHLNHPENWVTGGDPATTKQKAFIETLESQHPDLVPQEGLSVESMGKTEASEVIDSLKSGKPVAPESSKDASGDTEPAAVEQTEVDVQGEEGKEDGENGDEGKEGQVGGKRKASSSSTATKSSPKTSKTASAASSSGKANGATSNGQSGSRQSTSTKTDDEPVKSSEEDKGAKSTLQDVVAEEKSEEPQAKKAKTESNGTSSGKAEQTEQSESAKASGEDEEAETSGTKADPIEVDSTTPVDSYKPSATTSSAKASTDQTQAEPDTLPGEDAHLDHPENWTTGDEPATAKQKGYLKVLEKQKGADAGDVSGMGKSEASEKIDEMKHM